MSPTLLIDTESPSASDERDAAHSTDDAPSWTPPGDHVDTPTTSPPRVAGRSVVLDVLSIVGTVLFLSALARMVLGRTFPDLPAVFVM